VARRRWRPTAAAVGTTALLVALLGNQRMLDVADEAGPAARPLLEALTTAPAWAASRLPDGAGPAVAAKLATLLLVVAGLVRLASGVRSRVAGWLAGWGALAVASALAQLVYVVLANLDREAGGTAAAAVAAMNDGAVFGLYAGWLVGLVVAVTVEVRDVADAATSPPPVPVASWPPKPSIGTNRPNPAWQASPAAGPRR
jgi:hypothetical protein